MGVPISVPVMAGVVQAVRDGILSIAKRERIVTDFKVQV
jgi:hypothetical protein